jgi:GT2 family glycosyltransferase
VNVTHTPRIVVLGFLSHFPVAGVAWQTMHYLVGFQRLGFEVYYVEAHGCTPSKLMQHETDDGAARAAAYIEAIMRRIGLGNCWAYHSIYDSRYFGLSETQLKALYQSATLLINLHGSHIPNTELAATGRLVYLETDPVDVQIDLFHEKPETRAYLSPHCAFFTYGENLGKADCLVPGPKEFEFHRTRQPVVMDYWDTERPCPGECFTTVGNWRQPWREFTFQGEVYRWSKHLEFEKFIDLPSRVRQRFELALSSFNDADRQTLETHGWKVRPAQEISLDLDAYRQYISQSRGEFTVAKDQNVRLRSGWFSDRAVTYLAAGRPVITQETAFSNWLPTGEGLFGFSCMDDITGAIEIINGDYERHSRVARIIARECFGYEVVLTRLLQDLGISTPHPARAHASVLPPNMVIVPKSRWPTRLPQETIQTAEALPVPIATGPQQVLGSKCKASVILVTHGGLSYTKMCLTTLLGSGWYFGDELIVVDNGSTDGTREYLGELGRRNPWVQILYNDCNRGFSCASNQGLAKATGSILILLNPDTLVVQGWREGLIRWLDDVSVGMVGPVTNRTCNEAQIDAPYRTYGQLEDFALDYTQNHAGEANDISMLAMFCAALRRETLGLVGPLDEQFEVGMFEDDDYARRLRNAGYRILCAEDVFVHHFGQGSLGELCATNEYDKILESNRRRFEEKWGVTWKPHGRRISEEYMQLRQRIQSLASTHLPGGSTVAVISKGDEELLKLNGHRSWHFPQATDGQYANLYPANSAEAIAHLERLRAKGGDFLLIPKPAFWWLEHYEAFKQHLEDRYRLTTFEKDTCLIFDLGVVHE